MVGVIADDLTGAAELGGIALRHAWDAWLLRREAASELLAAILCWDTDTRNHPAAEAAARVAEVAGFLDRAGARRLFKKVDSVLRGPVLAEVEAMRRALGFRRVLLLPANPSRGRIIRDGQYWIHNVPLHHSEFARDPEHPRKTSEVLALLGTQPGVRVTLAKGSDPLPLEGVVLAEAASEADVKHWAARWQPDTLAAGGADFFDALLLRWDDELRTSQAQTNRMASTPENLPTSHRQVDQVDRKTLLLVSGTTSPAAAARIQELRQAGTVVLSCQQATTTSPGSDPAERSRLAEQCTTALRKHGRAVLCVEGPRPPRSPERPGSPALSLAQLAADVLQRFTPDLVLAEGGATAARLVEQLGWSRLHVVREWAPGVVELTAEHSAKPALIIKPGSYPWPDPLLPKSHGCQRE